MPLPNELLALARELVDRNAAAPVEAELRRAVSTAYYAVFHLLVAEAVDQLIAIPKLRGRVARAFEHSVMRSVCNVYANLQPDATGALVTDEGSITRAEIVRVADHFVTLQTARHQADYAIDAAVTQAQADLEVKRAESAFTDWNAISAEPAAGTFLAELLCRSIRKR